MTILLQVIKIPRVQHILTVLIFFLWRYIQTRAYTASLFVYSDHTQLETQNQHDSSTRVISSSKRPLPAQQTQQTNIHALGGIRTRVPRNPADADLCLRKYGHRDRLTVLISFCYFLLGSRLERWSAIISFQDRNARDAKIPTANDAVLFECLITVIFKCRNMPHCTIQQCRTNTR
jgi:hypothetical protein